MEKIDGERIKAAANNYVRDRLDVVEVFAELESTNSYLLNQSAPLPGNCRLAIAEYQTAGRGRMGKVWQSPRLSGLYLSASYTFPKTPQNFSCLTLATGVAIVAALDELGAGPVSLKWPNDLIAAEGKLGGILTESQPGTNEEVSVVIGIGLNLDMQGKLSATDAGIGRVSDLKQVISVLPERLTLITVIVDQLVQTLVRFGTDGFGPFFHQWRHLDWLKGKAIHVDTPDGQIDGTATGIDENGALLVDTIGPVVRVVAGTVTLS